MGVVIKNDPLRLILLMAFFFNSKTVNIREELRDFIPGCLRRVIRKEFNYNPLVGIFGVRKTYFQIFDFCYFPKKTKIVRDYVSYTSTCKY